MKFFNITLLFVIFALICTLSTTVAQGDDAAGPKRVALRRPVGGKAAKTTTTAAPAQGNEEEGDYNDENQENQYGDEGEEGGASSTTTTSTEPPKKVGPVIRPFRSNDDFLNSLKRRQQNAKKHRSEKPTPKSKPTAAAEEEGDDEEESAAAPAPAPAKGFKAGNPALNRRKLIKPGKPEPPVDDAAAEGSENEQKEDSKLKRPLGRLALRKQN